MSRRSSVAITVLLVVTSFALFLRITSVTTNELTAAEEPAAPATEKNAREATQDRLRELLVARLVERRQILQKIAEIAEERYKAGRITSKEVKQARLDFMLAEIDLCETSEERIEIRKKIVELYEKGEEAARAGMSRGRVSAVELHRATVDRIEAEIELVREQLKSGSGD